MLGGAWKANSVPLISRSWTAAPGADGALDVAAVEALGVPVHATNARVATMVMADTDQRFRRGRGGMAPIVARLGCSEMWVLLLRFESIVRHQRHESVTKTGDGPAFWHKAIAGCSWRDQPLIQEAVAAGDRRSRAAGTRPKLVVDARDVDPDRLEHWIMVALSTTVLQSLASCKSLTATHEGSFAARRVVPSGR